MLIGDFETRVAIIRLSLAAFGDDHTPVEVLLKRHLSTTGAMVSNPPANGKLPWIALTFAPPSALVSSHVVRSVVEIVQRAKGAIRARSQLVVLCLCDCFA